VGGAARAFAATSFGEWDLYGAFLEKSVDWLTGDGRVALIVPSRWLTARWAGPLRAHLAARRAVVAVIELGAAQLFANATTYASIAILGGAAQPGARPIHRHGAGGWRTDALDLARLGDAPWIAAAPTRRGRGPAPALTLGEVAVIAKGAGTNADAVFVLPAARRDGRWLISGDAVIEADAGGRACAGATSARRRPRGACCRTSTALVPGRVERVAAGGGVPGGAAIAARGPRARAVRRRSLPRVRPAAEPPLPPRPGAEGGHPRRGADAAGVDRSRRRAGPGLGVRGAAAPTRRRGGRTSSASRRSWRRRRWRRGSTARAYRCAAATGA
jgi:hypothetical protein